MSFLRRRLHASQTGCRCAVLLVLLAGSVGLPLEAAEDSKKVELFRYNSGGKRDPFVPLVRDGRLVAAAQGAQMESTKPVLYGILWDPGGNSIALINDGEVKVGDAVGEYLVKEIRHDAVVLENGGEPVVLRMAFDTPPSKLPPGATKGGEGP